jgi:uncharacterized protein DUF3592
MEVGPVGSVALIAVVIAGFAAGIWLVVHRERQLRQLADDGVDVKGTVVRQSGGEHANPCYIRYRYRDNRGQEREHKVQVLRDFWANHPEGSFIAVVYSKSKPSISGVKYQVDQKRKALAKRRR